MFCDCVCQHIPRICDILFPRLQSDLKKLTRSRYSDKATSSNLGVPPMSKAHTATDCWRH
jgi:hypothetical protein